METKIFIIVPVYNVERYLDRCLQSILAQTYENYEVVLIDDGSPDLCPEICDKYARAYTNIITIHQTNMGLSGARNTGIEYALSHSNLEETWITFIDSDDYIHPRYLTLLREASIKNDTSISICNFIRTKESNVKDDGIQQCVQSISPEEMWNLDRTIAMIVPAKLYKLKLFEHIRFPVGMIHEDEFTTYKVLFQEDRVSYLDAKLYYYFQNDESIMRSEWTPKHLVSLIAFENQLEYFKSHNLNIAYSRSFETYCTFCIKYVRYLEVASPKYDDYLKDIRKKTIYSLARYGKEFGYRKSFSIWFRFRISAPIKKALKNESIFSFIKRQILRCLIKE